jgi:TorA maturation chaperone TorD
MEDHENLDEVFTTISQCFAPVDESVWNEFTRYARWKSFIDGCTDAMCGQDATHPELPDFLSDAEIDALHNPPTYEQKQQFAACHFTGGLPESAMPVESLYETWTNRTEEGMLFPQAKGLYGGDAAEYMDALIESMGLTLPDMFKGCPDHIAMETDMAALLFRSNLQAQATSFVAERFKWLTAYRMRLLEIKDNARFYIGLIDVLTGIAATYDVASDVDETSTQSGASSPTSAFNV